VAKKTKVVRVKEKMASEVNLENSKTTTNSEEAPIPLQRQIPRFKAGDQDSTIESKSQVLEIEEEGVESSDLSKRGVKRNCFLY
jgi:hypothetical protein